MLWEEFRDQARQDLSSCTLLFEKGDYGNAAFLSQQGIEKYVKSYLIGFELFIGKPYKLTHLPLVRVWEILVENVNNKVSSSSSDVKELYQKSALVLGLVKDIFIKMTNQKHPQHDVYKYGIWKETLGLPLSTRECNIINQIKNNMDMELLPLVTNIQQQLSDNLHKLDSFLYANPLIKKSLDNLVFDLTNSSINEIMNSKVYPINDLQEMLPKIPKFFEQMEKIIIKLTELSKNKGLLLSLDLMKLLLLSWIFSFREEIIATFPHEQLGRYPESLSGSTRKIYATQAPKLEELIKRVIQSSRKIDSMMDLLK